MLNDQLYQKLIFLPYLKSSHGNICLLMCLLCLKVGVGVPCPLTDPYCSSTSTQHYKRTPVSFPECVGAVGRLTPPGSLQMFSEPHPGSAPAGLLGQTWLPVHIIRTLAKFLSRKLSVVKVHWIAMTNFSPARTRDRLWRAVTSTRAPLPFRNNPPLLVDFGGKHPQDSGEAH